MMSKTLVLVLVVLGALGSATATAQPVEPTFFAVANFGDFVAAGQPVAIKMVDLSIGERNQFFICRDPNGEAVCFPPLESGGTFVDTIPTQSVGKLVVYQIAKAGTGLNSATTDWGFVKAQVGYNEGSWRMAVGTASIKAYEPKIVQCQSQPGAECPAIWITEPNWFSVQAAGNYPAGTSLFILATAKDGGTGVRPTKVEITYPTSEMYYMFRRVTYRRSPISLTEFEAFSRTFRTLEDVIGPIVSNPSLQDR